MQINIDKVCNIAKNAGQAIMSVYDGDHAVEYKEDKSPLTAADMASHEVIVAGLQKHFPEILEVGMIGLLVISRL